MSNLWLCSWWIDLVSGASKHLSECQSLLNFEVAPVHVVAVAVGVNDHIRCAAKHRGEGCPAQRS